MSLLSKDITKMESINYTKLHSPKMKSVYWRYFGFPSNDNDRILTKLNVVCTLCHKMLTNHGNTTNLRAHLQHRHKEIFKKICLENDIKVPPRKTQIKTWRGGAEVRAITIENERNGLSNERKIKSEYIDNAAMGVGLEEDQTLYETMVPMTYEDDEIIDADHFAKVEVGAGLSEHNAKSLSSEGAVQKENFQLDVINEMQPYQLVDSLINMIIVDINNVDLLREAGMSQLIRTFGSNTPSEEKIETMLREMHSDKHTTLTDEIKMHSQIKPFSLGFEIWDNIDKTHFLSIYYNYTTEAPQYNLINRLYTTFEYNKYVSIDAVFEEFNLDNCTAAIVSYDYDDYLKHFLRSKNIPIILSYDVIVDKCLLNVFSQPEVASILDETKEVIMRYASEINSKNVHIPNVNDDFPWTNYEFLKFFCENVSWPDDIDVLVAKAKIIVDVLNNLALTLDTLKGEEIPHSSMLTPMTARMLNNKLAVNDGDDDLTSIIKAGIHTMLEKWVITDDNLTISALLDPRFHRLTNVTNLSSCIDILTEKYKRICETGNVPAADATPQSKARKTMTEGAPKKSNLELFFDIQESSDTADNRESNSVETDLKRYRNEVYVSLDESPFLWWSKMGHLYGTLKHLAVLYQCVPCVVNMNFKKPIKQQIHEHRKRFMLTGPLVNIILFLHFNSKIDNLSDNS